MLEPSIRKLFSANDAEAMQRGLFNLSQIKNGSHIMMFPLVLRLKKFSKQLRLIQVALYSHMSVPHIKQQVDVFWASYLELSNLCRRNKPYVASEREETRTELFESSCSKPLSRAESAEQGINLNLLRHQVNLSLKCIFSPNAHLRISTRSATSSSITAQSAVSDSSSLVLTSTSLLLSYSNIFCLVFFND